MTVVQDILNRFIIDTPTTTPTPTDDTTIAKSIAMCVLFIASLTIGLIPLKLNHLLTPTTTTNPKQHAAIAALLCFGGGVLLCTTFLHLLPEVGENIDELQRAGAIPPLRIHLASALMCAGFFTMYLVEEVAHYYIHRARAYSTCAVPDALRRSLSIRRGDTNDLIAKTIVTEAHAHTHVLNDEFARSLRGFLVVLALSVHELFEGLAVGLEVSTATVWYMLGAVSAHKLVIAFCIGVELITMRTRTALVLVYVGTFAAVSPLGIGIGILITQGTNNGGTNTGVDVPSAVLQGLATGTLLYVVFFEILQKEMIGGLRPYLAVLLGFLVMFAITVFAGHEHSHSDSHDDSEHNHMATAARALSGAAVSAVTSQPPDDFTHTY